MKNKHISHEVIIAILLFISIASLVAVANLDFTIFIIVFILFLIASFLIAMNAKNVKKIIREIFNGENAINSSQNISFENLNIPVMVANRTIILWYNTAFKKEFLEDENLFFVSTKRIFKNLDKEKCSKENGQSITIANKKYTVHSSFTNQKEDLYVAYFINDTVLKEQASEYLLTKPVVFSIVLDTYDEVLKEVKDTTRAVILANIDKIIEDFTSTYHGVWTKLGTSRYNIVIEERYYEKILNSKFDILNKVRNISEEHSVTLSIGVGRSEKSFLQNSELSRQALDMALGRGGDQAVIKSGEEFTFFGGVMPSVEKRSRVRSRIIANTLKDLINKSEITFIMGHKMSDLDAIGSALGVYAAVESCGQKGYIVVNEDATVAQNLIDKVKNTFADKEIFITPERALEMARRSSLLVVVDCHTQKMSELGQLAEICERAVIIDHHRRLVDEIIKSVVSYHEPYASSASELVTELIQYIFPQSYDMSPVYADALLSGIMLDTRHFSEQCGVRTFEAAAYLRRQGASTANVLRLFSVSKELYDAKANIVRKASLYNGIAISLNEELDEEMMIAIPQAANDLLGITDIDASIVAVKIKDRINISARSLGSVNVQVLMEEIGGGGHLTMAGAQLYNTSLEQASELIKQSINKHKE